MVEKWSKNLKMIFKLVLIALTLNLVHSADWNYDDTSPNGPRNWGRVSPNCNGQRQSPIDINPFNVIAQLLGPRVAIQGIDKRPTAVNYANDGHGYSVSFTFADGIQPTVSGGPLGRDTYIFHNFHVHWRSEHAILGHLKDAELHMVHFNSKYADINAAISQSDGLAVLGFLYSVPLFSRSTVVRPFIASSSNVRQPESSFVDRTNLFTIAELLGTRSFPVWSYLGSLTTPNCNEAVTWMVNKHVLSISPAELQALRLIKDDSNNLLLRNNRPVQPINGRVVSCYP